MSKNYPEKEYNIFVKKVYSYCDMHEGEKVLFPFFMNLWNDLEDSSKKRDLAFLTSRIAERLIQKNVIEEVPNKFASGYGFYKILEHEKLVLEDKKFNKVNFLS